MFAWNSASAGIPYRVATTQGNVTRIVRKGHAPPPAARRPSLSHRLPREESLGSAFGLLDRDLPTLIAAAELLQRHGAVRLTRGGERLHEVDAAVHSRALKNLD